MRRVPTASVQPVQLLLSDASPQDSATGLQLFEFIVRTDNGTTIAVVQPDAADLHPGEAVRIDPVAPPHIAPPGRR